MDDIDIRLPPRAQHDHDGRCSLRQVVFAAGERRTARAGVVRWRNSSASAVRRRYCASRSARCCSSCVRRGRALQQRLGLDGGVARDGEQGGDGAVDCGVEVVVRARPATPARCAAPPPRRPIVRSGRSPSRASSPTRSTSRFVPPRSGTMPRAGSAILKLASAARMRMSAPSASWNPPPIAWPCTAAIETRSAREVQSNARCHSPICSDAASADPAASSRIPGDASGPRTSSGRGRR